MKDVLVGKHHSKALLDSNGHPQAGVDPDIEITEEEFEQQYGSIKQYLLAANDERKRQGSVFAYIDRSKLPKLQPPFSDIIYKISSYTRLLSLATPESLNKFLAGQLSEEGKDLELAATSLGPLFASTNPADRRSLMYRLCLGRDGFFEDTHFDEEGKQVIESIVELATTVHTSGIEGSPQHNWSEREREVFKLTAVEVFKVFPPARRTEVLARLVNLIADNGGQVTRDQLVLFSLSSLGGIGDKIGQMDFISQALGVDLGSLKENASPLPKTTIAQLLKADGRDTIYDGIGASLKSGSIGSVVELRKAGESDCGVIAKVIKPEVVENMEADLEVVAIVLRNLNQLGLLQVNIDQILTELKDMVREEINPTMEYATMKLFAEAKSYKNPFNVGMPDAVYASDRHLEVTKINGKSLGDIIAIKTRARNREKLTKEEKKYARLDLTKAYADLFGDFLFQALEVGMFHSDKHEGNEWILPNGKLTEIDYGQTGLEIDINKRDAMLLYTVGIAMSQPSLVTRALQAYDPSLSSGAIMSALENSDDLAKTTTNFISDHHIHGSINRFSKAMVTNAPYITALKQTVRGKVLLMQRLAYYASSRGMLMDIAKLVPSSITGSVVKHIPGD
jgi:predicted unusual protein kinase regulating ubiquinone biosynthesis (AarF/ABC1/UbiB family)